ncbi:Uma2 family endonuclease [Merismopedia glauca]|uniref:Putative restriction endonuclease domain-containing protein n=1 Tax=Merismopedia glauca CCAP 1448/3 TaxID=1296344 RepID=A0A2T1CA12_9CYAN|nr:Uma2 family endonuclease [Merismopedia glauca]PSB04998.1 hypothetical protein C7B64_01140 [Merismopedia glauca CCAP 1448/3]
MSSSAMQRICWTTADLDLFADESKRYEIIDGELFVTRAPHLRHQGVADAICAQLRSWSRQSNVGNAFTGIGLIFSETDNVIADVIWISLERLNLLLDESGHLTGAPELVVEVLSTAPKDIKRDRELKLKLYSVQGVQEYWIADRQQQAIEIYRREDGVLKRAITLLKTDELTSPLLSGFRCEVEPLFE